MEILVLAAVAVAILVIIAFASPVQRRRSPVHYTVGRDHHANRVRRAGLAPQVEPRRAPRALRVSGPNIRPVHEAVVIAPASVPVQLPARPAAFVPAVTPPRLDWARQTSQSISYNQRERNADNLVASLVQPRARAS